MVGRCGDARRSALREALRRFPAVGSGGEIAGGAEADVARARRRCSAAATSGRARRFLPFCFLLFGFLILFHSAAAASTREKLTSKE